MAPEESVEASCLLQSFKCCFLVACTLHSFPWQVLFYMNKVMRGLSICNTCLLRMLQAIIIRSSTSWLARFKQKPTCSIYHSFFFRTSSRACFPYCHYLEMPAFQELCCSQVQASEAFPAPSHHQPLPTELPKEKGLPDPSAAAEMEDKLSIPEECSAAMNKVLSYELHISDAYLSMACNSIDESVQPNFATFFEDQANVKRENGKEFLEYLGKYRNKICLPVFKRPEIDYWGTGISALECALELEDQLTKLLMDLKTTASAKKERDVLEFTGKYLKGQKKSTKNLQIKIGYCKEFEKQAQKEEKPAES
ncbi:uncharacterized protein LOC129147496 [Eptesicus fuscus]|uniref:uncharacterized protein LOC129147496 n=1 Tax=Eptesicus fuscus TaxID=29078 RepID=UPI0024047A8B|nr:uncharacterized protein LOC129147496 [Eptesicus fuscus]